MSEINQKSQPKRLYEKYKKEYESWIGMKKRCYSKNFKYYHNYGGRGITVCSRWLHNFEHFIQDMGPKPSSEHSIDRINNDGNYEPSNCRWATWKEQNNNKRCKNSGRSDPLEKDGVTKSIRGWCLFLKIRPGTVYKRIRLGWSRERAVFTPIRPVFSS